MMTLPEQMSPAGEIRKDTQAAMEAQFELAKLYEQGIGTDPDPAKALAAFLDHILPQTADQRPGRVVEGRAEVGKDRSGGLRRCRIDWRRLSRRRLGDRDNAWHS